MRRWNVVLGCALLTVLLAAGDRYGLGTRETGPNAWCFRPIVVWWPVAAEAYVPQIECEDRRAAHRRAGGVWSSDATAELAFAPDGWSLPTRSLRLTRWGWAHEYDALDRSDLHRRRDCGASRVSRQLPIPSPSSTSASPVPSPATLHVGVLSDVAPLEGTHAVVWWTDRSEYRRAEIWDAEQLPDGSDFYRALGPVPRTTLGRDPGFSLALRARLRATSRGRWPRPSSPASTSWTWSSNSITAARTSGIEAAAGG